MLFFAAPLAAKGLPIARPATETLLLAVVLIVVVLSDRRAAIAAIILGLGATLASLSPGLEMPPLAMTLLRRGGSILTFLVLTSVVLRAVFAPGRITPHRLQGAAVVSLNFAMIFASAFSLIWELEPAAFGNLPAMSDGPSEFATMLYFSLATLTTTGYGDISPVDPLARGLANFESVIGPFYLAITLARLVTLELEGRRR